MNVWLQLEVDYAPAGLGIWAALAERPGGLWGALEGETLLIENRHAGDVWHELNDETLIIRPRRNLWQALAQISLAARPGMGIWALVGDETLAVSPPEASLWSAAMQSGDISLRKPARRLGWALKALQTAAGENYFVLKNTRSGAYLRLTDEQVFLWNLMDGAHSLRDLAVAYYVEYRALAPEGLLEFLGKLEANGFLVATRGDIYQQTARSLGQARARQTWQKLVRAFTQTTFSIHNIDGLLARFYAGGIFLLYTRVAQVLMALVTLAGLGAFGYHAVRGNFSLLRGANGELTLGLIGLYLAQFCAILLHEAAHAFTVRHYGRQVRRAGFMLYFGMPAFFVDTSDIWMEPRKPRMLVSWAGPYVGLFLGGLSSLLIFLVPSLAWSGWLFQFAFSCLLLSFVNLNPLLRWDGYYILMDWLEMPMLRDRAFGFIRRGLWKKLFGGESFSQDDKIYTIFGFLSLLWTV
ncbi:MAG: hypothetical protein H8E28_14950, partial [Anaerolineae bacterium]|nr:hypothetical protein [Anaerolineae bacterium]